MFQEISPILRWHFNMFRAFGNAPISFRTNHKAAILEESLWILYNVVTLTLFTALTIVVFSHSEVFLYTKDGFGYFVDSIKLIVTFITLSITLSETILQRRKLKQFWIIFAALAKCRHMHRAPLWHQIREYRFFLLWLYGLTLLCWILEGIFGLTVIKSPTNLIYWFWLMFLPYVYALRYRDLNFVFYIELIRKELKQLEKELGLLVAYTEFGQNCRAFDRFNEFIRENLLQKQKIYMQIYDMVECFKKSSGCSLMAGYLKCYIRIVVDCYWVFWSIYQNMEDLSKNKKLIFISTLWCLVNALISQYFVFVFAEHFSEVSDSLD